MRAFLGSLGMLLAWLALPMTASAQGPTELATPHLEAPHSSDPSREVPIGSYTLATFWVPQHCKQAIRGIAEIECTRPEIRNSGLALHGLWPDGEGKEWPQWCKPAALLSSATIAAHYDVTPSPQQLQHEWAKHGTCMTDYTPERYLDRAEQLYRAIHIPDLKALSYRDQTVASVKQAIVNANPRLRPETFKLTLDQRGWLQEIWFCLDTKFTPRACAEPQRESPESKVLIWRGGHARSYRTSYRNDLRHRSSDARSRYS